MANTNAPFGLKPVRHINGSSWNGQATMYFIDNADTVAYYIGDVVKSTNTGDLTTGAPGAALYGTRGSTSTSGVTRGVIVGIGSASGNSGNQAPIGADPSNLDAMFIPATKTKDYYIWVCDDPTVVYEAQTNTIAATAFNENTGLLVALAPTAPANQSATTVDGASATTTSSLPIKIFGAPNRPDNDLTSPGTNAKIYVMLNTHELFGNSTAV
jgi:hypothetical protein